MGGTIITNVLSYGGYVLEAGLLVYLFRKGYAKRLWEVVLYLAASLGANGARAYTLGRYGFASRHYSYCYWTTDFLLVLVAFIVIASFFRRACSENQEMWRQVRLLLVAVLIGVFSVSVVSLSHHTSGIFTFFIVEFQQNLYFACLVLNTLLYLLVLKMAVADDRLAMLSCGLGIQFAGPAACLALYYLTGNELGHLIGLYLVPLCDIGMILTWFYAIARVPRAATAPHRARPEHVAAEGALFQS
jgi:hypothetical protein